MQFDVFILLNHISAINNMQHFWAKVFHHWVKRLDLLQFSKIGENYKNEQIY